MASAVPDNLHNIYRPLLAAHLLLHLVREECVAIGMLVARLLFGKTVQGQAPVHGGPGSWPQCPALTGMVNEDKLNQLMGWWAKHVDDCYPDVHFGAKSGLAAHTPLASQSAGGVGSQPLEGGCRARRPASPRIHICQNVALDALA